MNRWGQPFPIHVLLDALRAFRVIPILCVLNVSVVIKVALGLFPIFVLQQSALHSAVSTLLSIFLPSAVPCYSLYPNPNQAGYQTFTQN